MSYTPQADSLAAKVVGHLRKHPDDELASTDIAAMFKVHAKDVDALLSGAVAAGALNRRSARGDKVPVFMAGVRIAAVAPAPAAAAPSFPTMPPPTRTRRAPLPVFDAAALAVEADVAMPASKRGAQTDWPVLFERLTEVGMCSCPLPKLVKGSLAGAANAWFKPRGLAFAIRAISDTHLRIWRVDPTTKEAK